MFGWLFSLFKKKKEEKPKTELELYCEDWDNDRITVPWDKTDIKIHVYQGDLPDFLMECVELAMMQWNRSEVIDLSITEDWDEADIHIYPYDLHGRTAGYAYFPGYDDELCGDIRIDSSNREWSYWLLKAVLRHEIGHALGLKHNDDPMSVMYFMASSRRKTTSYRDVDRLDRLYRLYKKYGKVYKYFK
jgi:predicted Zn-dependent protease